MIFTILQCNPFLLSVVSNIYLCVPQGQPMFIGLNIQTEYYKITQKGEIDDQLGSIKLYLPTRMNFSIGRGRATCRWSKLTNSLERTKLNNSPGKQRELSTRT